MPVTRRLAPRVEGLGEVREIDAELRADAPDGAELRVDLPCLEARDVGLARAQPLGQLLLRQAACQAEGGQCGRLASVDAASHPAPRRGQLAPAGGR